MELELTIGIATAGRPTLLARTLQSMSEAVLPNGYRETIVIENGPRCGVEDVVRCSPKSLRTRYLYEPQANKSAALNRLLEETVDGLILFADDDIRIEPENLCCYREAAVKQGPGWFFGGSTRAEYELQPPSWLMKFLLRSTGNTTLGNSTRTVHQPVFMGCNWAAHVSDLKATGGFDVRKGPGSATRSVGQEADMQQRFLKRGLQGLYLPDAVAWHHVPRSRCSPQWTLDRSFREGICGGIDAGKRGTSLFRRPLKDSLKLFRSLVGYGATRLSNNPRLRFYGEHKWHWRLGYRQGCKLENTTQAINNPRHAA
jgi:GT2 family glycosyltransferase